MDAEKLLQAFTPHETNELVAALPAEVLQAELSRRGLEVAPAIGTVATEAAAPSIYSAAEAPKTRFEQQLSTYLDPEAKMSLEDQVEVMTAFWNQLGFKIPSLRPGQADVLVDRLEDAPTHYRLMPTPLLNHEGRKAIVEVTKVKFPNNNFAPHVDALWTPGEDYMYGMLLRNPDSTVKEGRKEYGLRYNTPEGVVTRPELVEILKAGGTSAEATDGTTWTFPVMDVQVESPRTYARAGELHEAADITQVPEALITMQALHQANDTPNPNWSIDITNEAVYELDKKGVAVSPVRVTSVYWYRNGRQVTLDSWGAAYRHFAFGVRGAESGL